MPHSAKSTPSVPRKRTTRPVASAKRPVRPAPKLPVRPPARSHSKSSEGTASAPVKLTFRPDARRHLLSLSFLRDGDDFLARLETDSGQITEMKNRALDQLLSLVAGELEDLLG